MNYIRIKVSSRKYLIGQIENPGCKCNLQYFSRDKLGIKGQMLPLTQATIVSKKLDLSKAMELYCYLETGAELTDELKELLI